MKCVPHAGVSVFCVLAMGLLIALPACTQRARSHPDGVNRLLTDSKSLLVRT